MLAVNVESKARLEASTSCITLIFGEFPNQLCAAGNRCFIILSVALEGIDGLLRLAAAGFGSVVRLRRLRRLRRLPLLHHWLMHHLRHHHGLHHHGLLLKMLLLLLPLAMLAMLATRAA